MRPFSAPVAWTLAGNTIYAGCQWAMLVVIAKLGSADALGSFALAFALTAPVMMLSGLQLRAVQATDAQHQFEFGHYLALRLITTGAALLVCLVAGLFGVSRPILGVVMLVAAAKAIESMSDAMYGLMQRRQDMRSIAVSMVAKGLVSVAALGLILYLTGSLPLACLTLAASWGLILALYDRRVARRLVLARGMSMQPIWDWRHLRSLATMALPLGLVTGVFSLQANVPRYFIGASLSVSDVGVFAAVASLGVIGSTICNALGQEASPRLANDYAAMDQRSFLRNVAKLLSMALAIGIACVAAASTLGPWLLAVLFRPEYARMQEVFVILMCAAGLSYLASVLGYALTAARRFQCQLPIFATALVVTAVICAWLIPRTGLQGAAIGAAAGSLTQLVGASWALLATAGVRAEMRRMQWAAL
jgi:O-antigen/teichoic acid export membrane protein